MARLTDQRKRRIARNLVAAAYEIREMRRMAALWRAQRPTPERDRPDDDEVRYACRHSGAGKRRALLSDGGPRQTPTMPSKPFNWRDG